MNALGVKADEKHENDTEDDDDDEDDEDSEYEEPSRPHRMLSLYRRTMIRTVMAQDNDERTLLKPHMVASFISSVTAIDESQAHAAPLNRAPINRSCGTAHSEDADSNYADGCRQILTDNDDGCRPQSDNYLNAVGDCLNVIVGDYNTGANTNGICFSLETAKAGNKGKSKNIAKFKKRAGAKAVKSFERNSAGADGVLHSGAATTFRAISARANYLASDRADGSFGSKELCR